MHSFFDKFDIFTRSSAVGAWPLRLQFRYEVMIRRNRDLLRNARVLDLASHDGRWSFAALEAGAAHVTGWEARRSLIEKAETNFRHYNVDSEKYIFREVDLNYIFSSADLFDVIFCFGYFYHSARHDMLFELMASTGARHLILDGRVSSSRAPIIEYKEELIRSEATGFISGRNQRMLVGAPSAAFLRLAGDIYSYEIEEFDWGSFLCARGIEGEPGFPQSKQRPMNDYALGQRSTFLATRR